jgi:thiamine-monophosphate kinase
MGATPAWVTLAISLPEINENWLQAFSNQFSAVLSKLNISLIGGDTTRGALSITVQAMGFCDKGKLLRRDQAEENDRIFVTGNIGDAGIGLQAILKQLDDDKLLPCINRLNRPDARVNFAEELTLYSKCAIDISDGLIADLGHIISASFCGAKINLSAIPLSSSARHYFDCYNKSSVDWSLLLTQGDDYELCFTVHSNNESAVKSLAKKHRLKLSCIGEITASNELIISNENNEPVNFSASGFQHF